MAGLVGRLSLRWCRGQQIKLVKKFKYLGYMIISDGKCITEIKKRIATAKDAFQKLSLMNRNISMRLTYIYFFIAFTLGSHDFRFDMGRMGIRAGKLTSPEFFDGSTCAQYV